MQHSDDGKSKDLNEHPKEPNHAVKQDYEDYRAELLDMLNRHGNGA